MMPKALVAAACNHPHLPLFFLLLLCETSLLDPDLELRGRNEEKSSMSQPPSLNRLVGSFSPSFQPLIAQRLCMSLRERVGVCGM